MWGGEEEGMSGQEEKGSKFVVVVVQSSMHGIMKPVFSVCVVVGFYILGF